MSNKVNILEEINKMKSLISAKAGTVISEQENSLDTDVMTVRNQITQNSSFGSNVPEQKIVDVIKKYTTDKNTFDNFLNKFKQKYNVNLSDIMPKGFDFSDDATEIADLNSSLQKIGMKYVSAGAGIAKFEEISAMKQRNINTYYCRVKDGKIVFPNKAYNGSLWSTFVSEYKVTPEEIATAKEAAKTTCPQVVVSDVAAPASNAAAPATDGKAPAETPKPTGPTPTQRLAATAKSLGVENPKLDVATLQTILNTLNQGPQGVTESKNSVNEELKMMKYLLGYQRGKVISEQDAPAATTPAATTAPAATATPQDLIKQIQTVLKTKYNANLGNYGVDGVDGKWGNLTQTALENALKTVGETKQKAAELSQSRASETQQTSSQDAAIQQAAEKGRMEIPQTNNLPTTPGVQVPTTDIYTTLVNNKTLQTRDNGNKIVYKGADLPIAQRQELESKLQGMGYKLSLDNRDKSYGDKMIFKKN
jgi:hypothetical protein